MRHRGERSAGRARPRGAEEDETWFPAGPFRIIDISQPVSSATACFPGDVPFSRSLTARIEESGVLNLSALTMSPHVGTHADAPGHIRGSMADRPALAGALPLEPYLGPAVVVDVSPCRAPISVEQVRALLEPFGRPLGRVLIRTLARVRHDAFEDEYASLSVELVSWLHDRGAVLVGLDTPSVDPVARRISRRTTPFSATVSPGWRTSISRRLKPGRYFLIALPLKLEELEASPVRAVLLAEDLT